MEQSGLIQEEDDLRFRDLNKNGKLDIYEDPRQTLEARLEDLLSRMTL
jgi:beta-glucosidase